MTIELWKATLALLVIAVCFFTGGWALRGWCQERGVDEEKPKGGK